MKGLPPVRVVRFARTGGPEVMALVTEALRAPGPGEVAIRVQAIGLNRAEAAFRAGVYLEAPRLPAGLGYEATGEVIALGAGVAGLAPGQPVCVLPAFSMNDYAVYAEAAVVPAHAVIPRPPGLDPVQAAAFWMAYLTAWGGLQASRQDLRGRHVLVTAASSSVGLAALQVVRRLGGFPHALTRDARKAAALRGHGARQVIVGGPLDAEREAKTCTGGHGFDLILDPVAGPGVAALASALAPQGTVVLYGNLGGQAASTPFPFFPAVRHGLGVRGFLVFSLLGDATALGAARSFLLEGITDGSLRPVVDRTFELEDVVAAHTWLESNAQVGKVVVTVPASVSQ